MELVSNFEEEKVELWLRRDPASFLLEDLQIAVKKGTKKAQKDQSRGLPSPPDHGSPTLLLLYNPISRQELEAEIRGTDNHCFPSLLKEAPKQKKYTFSNDFGTHAYGKNELLDREIFRLLSLLCRLPSYWNPIFSRRKRGKTTKGSFPF